MSQCFEECTSLTKAPAIPASVKDMSSCFASCTSLKEVPAIPEGVQNMYGCFYKCTSFTESPAIPEGVQNMGACFFGCTALKSVVLRCNYIDNQFQHTFHGCNLPDSSIKVPHGQLTVYTAHTTEMGAQANWFAEE